MRTLCAWRWLSIFFFFLSFFSCVLVRLFDYFFSCFACAIFLFVFIVGIITRRRRECVSTNRFSKFNELQLASINLWIIENTHFELLKQTQCMVLDMRLSHLARNTNARNHPDSLSLIKRLEIARLTVCGSDNKNRLMSVMHNRITIFCLSCQNDLALIRSTELITISLPRTFALLI